MDQDTSPNTQAAVLAASSTTNNALNYAAMAPPQPPNPLSLASSSSTNPFLAASIPMHQPHHPSSTTYTIQTQPIAEDPRPDALSATTATTNETDTQTTTDQSSVESYPNQVSGPGGPTATAPFLRDFSLVAEAAKRAQMSVVMRDLESVTL
ncbi:hypothetical protein FE257_009268 [Aspergillus nanangensis]|uniref:Uncharacterized protein n=1 Tax=Aspergillus nanangensis TaxID=2582783 RepID=A0AAD4GSY2_ASPNN|nr:hypothetical protein FE257_009268 [Aspergillus nanangensis]